MQTTELIESIRGLLAGRAVGIAPEVLAAEYARRCREVNDRLVRIGLMLDSGGEIQALQLAEQPPRVVDAALALSFGREADWLRHCKEQGNEVAVLVDASALERLMSIQSRGIAPDHALYKEYRAAVSKRDEARAAELVRVIVRMNPGDTNAARELKRFERKEMQAAMADLRTVRDQGGEALLEAMRRVEATGLDDEYAVMPDWQAAVEERNRIRREDAWAGLPALIDEAQQCLSLGNWRQAALHHEEYTRLVGDYGAGPSADGTLETRARKVADDLAMHRAESERQAEIRQLSAKMENIAEQVEVCLVTPAGVTAGFAAPLAEELGRLTRRLEDLQGSLAGHPLRRVEEARTHLDAALAGERKAKRMRRGALIGVVALALLAAAFVGFVLYRASTLKDQLVSSRELKASRALRELSASIAKSEALVLRVPSLAAEHAASVQWLETADGNLALVQEQLDALKASERNGFANLESADLVEKLEQVGKLATELPPDMAETVAKEQSLLQNYAEGELRKRQQTADGKARELVTSLTAALESVDPAGPASAAAKTADEALAQLDPLHRRATLGHKLLKLPADTETLVADLVARAGELAEKTEAIGKHLEALDRASSPAGYREAVEALAACQFREGAAAQRIAGAWPDDERIKAFLAFRGNLAGLKVAATENSLVSPLPEAAKVEDRVVVSELMGDDALKLWEIELIDLLGVRRKLLALGEMVTNENGGLTGKLAEYPEFSAAELRFRDRTFPKGSAVKILSSKPSATTALVSRLSLDGLLDSTGTSFRTSIIPLLDSVANDTEADPLAKAYLFGCLLRIVRNHSPETWGLHHSPAFLDDMKIFETLWRDSPVGSTDWLATKRNKSAAVWEGYFSKRSIRGTYVQIASSRAAATEVIRNPLELAGGVSAEGIPSLREAASDRIILGVRAGEPDSPPTLRVLGVADRSGKWRGGEPKVAPLSPLLTITLSDSNRDYLLSIHPSAANAAAKPDP